MKTSGDKRRKQILKKEGGFGKSGNYYLPTKFSI